MRKIFLPLIFLSMLSSLLFGFDIGNQTTTQTPQNDPNIIIVQVPEAFELEAVNGKRCVPKNFFCPEIKFRKINKTSNAVLKEWYLEYDQKNISNIDYQSGNYTCTYSTNDIIEFSHNFTNKFCSEELKTQKDALKGGEQLLGYDFQRLNQAIESMPDILSARDTATQAEELRIPLNDVDYERKGFFTFSSMLTKILTFDTDFVGGTDLKMNLILKESMYDSSANTQTFTSGNVETVPVSIYSDGTVAQDQSSNQDTSNIFSYDNELTNLALESVGLDADIIDLTELVNTRTFGYLINFYFTNKSTLDFIIIVIVFLTMSKKAGIAGIDQIREKLNRLKNDRKDIITFLTIGSVAIIFFVLPLNGERIKINGREVTYSTTIAQDLVTTLADIATEYADIATNINILNTADFLKKETKVYSKEELNSMSEQVANELIVAQRQIDFMQQQCRPAYGIYNDTFVKSKTDYLLNKNYDLYVYGVPTTAVCKNTESSIYFNLKNIDANSKLIDYKVHAVNDHTVTKNLEALSAKLMLTSRDFGWIVSPMIYLSPRIYEEIGASLEEEQGKKIEQLTSTYFNKNSYLKEKKEDEYSLTNIMSNATFGVDVVAEYAFMHWVPTFTTIQTKIYDSLSFKVGGSETNEISQGKAKGKIMSWLSKVGSKLLNKLTTAVNIVVGGSALITSYILATLIVVTAIKSIKIALITALIGYKILIYVKDLIVLYYFNILIFVRIILNKKEENFIFLTSKSIYILIYPVFIVLAISLLIFVERFGQWLLKLYSNFQLESMKMTSHIAASNQDGIIDTVKVATSSIIKIGVAEGVYEIISLVLMFLLAWSMVVKLPEYLLELIGDKIGSSAQRDLTERADHKIDRTGV